MTPTQVAGIARVALPALLALLLPHVTEDVRTQIVTIVVAIIGSGTWSLASLSPSSLTKTVAAIDDVQVHVGPRAPVELQRLAADPTLATKDIVHK